MSKQNPSHKTAIRTLGGGAMFSTANIFTQRVLLKSDNFIYRPPPPAGVGWGGEGGPTSVNWFMRFELGA